jgi:hypothetical protein
VRAELLDGALLRAAGRGDARHGDDDGMEAASRSAGCAVSCQLVRRPGWFI